MVHNTRARSANLAYTMPKS